MLRALQHRGPDGEGEWSSDDVALGMRRLSIIDLEGGWQPLFNEDRNMVLVANGEIYNYIELRSDLQKRGHVFRTGSDCETIVHLYEEYGDKCVQYLRGMFAFALWDAQRRRVLLARDRMGEKPLYLFESARRVLFASELRALLASGLVPRELDPDAIYRYFYYQFVPEPQSPVAGVRKLPAGHTLAVEITPWRVTQRRYWSMEDSPHLDDAPAEKLRAELESVARLIVRSDVPVGIALSGGLDSSALAVLAAREYPGTLQAFSVGYPGRPETDERRHAEELAKVLGLPFHDVELDTQRMVSGFPDLVASRDDPIADISGFGYLEVMRIAREQGVPVMLQGQGGDELFWGYDWVRRGARLSDAKDRLLRGNPMALLAFLVQRECESSPASGLWGRVRREGRWLRDQGREVRRILGGPMEQFVFYDLTPDWSLAEGSVGNVLTPELLRRARSEAADPGAFFRMKRPWAHTEVSLTRLICETYLLENGITQGDRLSMAASVELRLPLIDYKLVETVIGLRKAQSDMALPPKAWLKDALQGLIPPEIMERPKRGFTPPVQEWHRTLFESYGKHLVDGYLVRDGILTAEGGRRMSEGQYPRTAIAPMSFKSLVLEIWCREVLDVNIGPVERNHTEPTLGAATAP
jgi:asparagine synthase (glutamine-hydrolysing)